MSQAFHLFAVCFLLGLGFGLHSFARCKNQIVFDDVVNSQQGGVGIGVVVVHAARLALVFALAEIVVQKHGLFGRTDGNRLSKRIVLQLGIAKYGATPVNELKKNKKPCPSGVVGIGFDLLEGVAVSGLALLNGFIDSRQSRVSKSQNEKGNEVFHDFIKAHQWVVFNSGIFV